MSLFKKKLTEQEAAIDVALFTIKECQERWPVIYKNLKDIFKIEMEVEDENRAGFDLALAAIAYDLQALKNLFAKEQAERVERYVLKFMDSDYWGQYAVSEVKSYGELWQKEIRNSNASYFHAIPARLLQRWLGKNMRNFVDESGIISPLLLLAVSTELSTICGKWKRLKDNFNITEGDTPAKL